MRTGTIVIVQYMGEFLAVDCHKDRGIIFPGGEVEDNESILDGAVREFKEETGFEIDKRDLQYIVGLPFPKEFFVHVFFATNWRQHADWFQAARDENRVCDGGPLLIAKLSELMESQFSSVYELIFQILFQKEIL